MITASSDSCDIFYSCIYSCLRSLTPEICKRRKEASVKMASDLSGIGSVDEVQDLLTYSLCSKTLEEPRILPCFHNFCKVYLGEYIFVI